MSRVRLSWAILAKIIFLVLLIYLIYSQVIGRNDLNQILDLYRSNLASKGWLLIFVVLFLMPINWSLEALKWKTLIQKDFSISFKRSLRAIISGISIGIITPQRIGEYGGRILSIPTKHRVNGILATLLCSIMQNIVNIGFGFLGLYFLNDQLELLSKYWMIFIVVSGVLIFILFYLIYRNTDVVKRILNNTKLPSKYKDWIYKLSYFKKIDLSEHVQVLVLSILRYAVYLCQYLFLLWFFGIDVSAVEGMIGISTIYLIQSGIPLPPLLDIAARAEISVLIWSIYSDNVLAMLSSTFALWIINLIIPSILGSFFVLKTNINNQG